MIRIRQARESDARQIAYVHTESWKTTYRGIVPDEVLDQLTTEARVSQWERSILADENNQIVLVAERSDGNIVGFACGGKEREEKLPYEGELYAIYILQEFQQIGIGQQLTERIVQHLQSSGMQSMIIWALERNSACRFYEKMGGVRVHSKSIRIGNEDLVEVAYGWTDLGALK